MPDGQIDRALEAAGAVDVTAQGGRPPGGATRPEAGRVSGPGSAIAGPGRARRALARLPEKAATAAVEFLYGSLAASPHRVGMPLKLGLTGLHSARRGDYRVIYHIDDHDHRIDVV